MKKSLVILASAAALALSGQVFAAAAEVSEEIWVGGKIYDRAFGRGCGACHDISTNPQLIANIKDGSLTKAKFVEIVSNGKNGMPKAGDAIDKVGKKKGYSGDKGINAIWAYLKGRADGSVPAGKLKKAK